MEPGVTARPERFHFTLNMEISQEAKNGAVGLPACNPRLQPANLQPVTCNPVNFPVHEQAIIRT
jgi:hypothetical protein